MQIPDEPEKGQPITREWGLSIVRAIRELALGPAVTPPLTRKDGAIGFGDNYLIRMVVTTSTITAMSGTTLGTGTVKFQTNVGTAVSDADGSYISRDVFSILDVTAPSGKYGYVAWVNESWHLISIVGC